MITFLSSLLLLLVLFILWSILIGADIHRGEQ